MDAATQRLVDEAPAWLDRHGDVWVFRNGMGWSFETQPFAREHIETKWGPLVPLEAAQRPPVSPEQREALDELIADVLIAERDEWPRDPGDAPSEVLAGAVTDALLARFSFPSQPVYDEEAIARWLFGLRYHSMHWLDAKEPERAEYHRDAAALIEALPTLTREETSE